jgi:hypothetical protein
MALDWAAFPQVGSAEEELQAALLEHTGWLASNCDAQVTNYAAFTEERGFPALKRAERTDDSTALVAIQAFSQEAVCSLNVP